MNCKINSVDFGIFTSVVYALLLEFTVIRGCRGKIVVAYGVWFQSIHSIWREMHLFLVKSIHKL